MQFEALQIKNEVFQRKREERELSTREVEEITNVGRSTISNLETGKNLPDGVNLLRLMFFYELSKEDIASIK